MKNETSEARILVCDDEAAARRGIARALQAVGHEIEVCSNGQECLDALAGSSFDLVLLDLRMPVMDGRQALAHIVAEPEPPPVVVLTADTSIETAIEAVESGAADFVTKPYEIEALRFVVAKTLETKRLSRENRRLEQEVRSFRVGEPGAPMVGQSPAMERVREAIERVAPTSAPVLILGETGTGKGLVARRIHDLGPRRDEPFVTVNCAAIPETLVESELFGHRRGAFTGADRDQKGRVQAADGGTLFLDEVGDMPLAAQAKLLRVLQDGVVEPLGGGGEVRVNVRVMAATHRDLNAMVGDGDFREDLLFRLRVVELEVPPLCVRGGDIASLAEHFLAELSSRPLRLTPEAAMTLRSYQWPGNVRELRNAVERATIFCRGGVVQVEDLPVEVAGAAGEDIRSADSVLAWDPGDDFQTAKRKVVERFERVIIGSALSEHGGNISGAARALGLHRQNLQQKIKQLGMDAKSYGGASDVRE